MYSFATRLKVFNTIDIVNLKSLIDPDVRRINFHSVTLFLRGPERKFKERKLNFSQRKSSLTQVLAKY